jgi:hypothetical protein
LDYTLFLPFSLTFKKIEKLFLSFYFCIKPNNQKQSNKQTNKTAERTNNKTMESIMQELNIRNNCIVSEISRGLENSHTRNNIINVLEKYDIKVLTELRNLIHEDTNIFYNKIMETRMAYVNSVRRRRMQKNNDTENLLDRKGFIDLSRNQDDTENLRRGLSIMLSAKEQVDAIIQNKQKIINMEIQNKKSKELIMMVLVSFVFAICIVFLLQNNLIKLYL